MFNVLQGHPQEESTCASHALLERREIESTPGSDGFHVPRQSECGAERAGCFPGTGKGAASEGPFTRTGVNINEVKLIEILPMGSLDEMNICRGG